MYSAMTALYRTLQSSLLRRDSAKLPAKHSCFELRDSQSASLFLLKIARSTTRPTRAVRRIFPTADDLDTADLAATYSLLRVNVRGNLQAIRCDWQCTAESADCQTDRRQSHQDDRQLLYSGVDAQPFSTIYLRWQTGYTDQLRILQRLAT